MKHISVFICLFLLSNVAHADKWLCGTAKWKTINGICGTYPDAYADDWFKQYFYIVDDTLNSEDGSHRVQIRELGGSVAFNNDNCTQGTIKLFCDGHIHNFNFDKLDYSFFYRRDRETRRDFRVTGRCTPFVIHETNSNMDFNDWMALEDESGLAEQEWSVEEYLSEAESEAEFLAVMEKFLAEVGFNPEELLSQ